MKILQLKLFTKVHWPLSTRTGCLVSFRLVHSFQKSIVGPDLGEGGGKYWNGVRAENGCIYCIAGYLTKHFLKITPNEGGDAEVQSQDH